LTVSSLSVYALTSSLTGSRRPNGLSGGSRNDGIVLLFELASQACGEGLGSNPWGIALRSVRVLDREKGSTVAEQGKFGEESIMVKQQVGFLHLAFDNELTVDQSYREQWST
jgi:hypothetical protein